MISNDSEYYLSDGPKFNTEQVRSAHRLAYFLHPQDDVALNVLKDGFVKSVMLAKTMTKRPSSKQPHKLVIQLEDLLHVGVILASEEFELYQELPVNSRPLRVSKCPSDYKPTLDDFIIRYVKRIYLKSHDRSARYWAIGIGTFIYRYKTIEILGLAESFDNGNSSKTRQFYERALSDRFPSIDLIKIVPQDERTIKLIECCFDIFTLPSVRKINFNQVINVRNEFFSGSGSSERDKFNALMKFGIPRLIAEYNEYAYSDSIKLDQPSDKLVLPQAVNPKFYLEPQDYKLRIKNSLLSEQEIQIMNAFLSKTNSPSMIEITPQKSENIIDSMFITYEDDL